MSLPTVDIYFRQSEQRLAQGSPPPIVPEGIIGIRVSLPRRTTITFDDEPLAAVWSTSGNTAYAQVDLTNRVGFHRIAIRMGVDTISFDFQTSTAKVTWDNINEMANHVARHVFAFRHQFRYTLPDGTRRIVPIPEIEFGWLRDRVPEIRALADDIAHRPGVQTRSRVVTSLRGGRVAVARTLTHLRENPHLMEAGDGGPFVVNNIAYWPVSVRVRVHEREPARQEHEQIAHFLRTLANSLIRLKGAVPKIVLPVFDSLCVDIAAARGHTVIKRNDTPRFRTPWSPVPTTLQKVDRRYGRLRALQAEYMKNIAPGEASDVSVRANIRDAWEIYQAFSAHIVGQSLGLSYISRRQDLRDRDSLGRSMTGGSIDLYYDTQPPEDVLPSWRYKTARPSAERPDIVLVNQKSRQAVVLDVKFRTSTSGKEANSADLQEMQGYMNNYGLPVGGIIFPGFGAARMHSDFGHTLVELPLRPMDQHDSLLADVRLTIATMWSTPIFSG